MLNRLHLSGRSLLFFWVNETFKHWRSKASPWKLLRLTTKLSLLKNWSFPLGISSVNVSKSSVNFGFGHIYWTNLKRKTSIFAQCIIQTQNFKLNPKIKLIIRSKQKFQPPKQTNKSAWKLFPSFAINLQ